MKRQDRLFFSQAYRACMLMLLLLVLYIPHIRGAVTTQVEHIEITIPSANNIRVDWQGIPHETYYVRTSTSLLATVWKSVTGITLTNMLGFHEMIAPDGTVYFRVIKIDDDPPIVEDLLPDAATIASNAIIRIQLGDETVIDTNSLRLSIGAWLDMDLSNPALSWANDAVIFTPPSALGAPGASITNQIVVSDISGQQLTYSWVYQIARDAVTTAGFIPLAHSSSVTSDYRLVSVTSTSVVFSYAVSPPVALSNGALLVSFDAGNPFYRSVVNYSVNGGQQEVSATTTNVPLTVLISEGSLATNGLHVSFSRDLSGDVLCTTADLRVRLPSGSYSFMGNIAMSFDVDQHELKVMDTTSDGQLTLAMAPEIFFYQAGGGNGSVQLASPERRVFGAMIGDLPVWIEVFLELDAAYTYSADASGTVTSAYQAVQSLDLHHRLQSNVWTPQLADPNANVTAQALGWTLEGFAHAQVHLKPKLTVLVTGLAGSWVVMSAYGEQDGRYDSSPLTYDQSSYYGLCWEVGTACPFWNKQWGAQLSWTEVEDKWLKWSSSYPSGTQPSFIAGFPHHYIFEGQSLVLSGHAVGSPAPSYRWTFNGAPIVGETGPTYSIASAQAGHTGYYKVEAYNSAGSVEAQCLVYVARNPNPQVERFEINDGALTTSDRNVILNNAFSGGPTAYMASEDSGLTGAVWMLYSQAPAFTLFGGAGTKTVYLKTRNLYGESDPISDFIEYQPAAPPTVESFDIAGGALSTSARNVALDNTCSGQPTAFIASEDSGFSGAFWMVYSTAPTFTLSDDAGIKTVYFKTRSVNGESNVRSDFIDYQPTAPPAVESFVIANDVATTSERTVPLNNACSGEPTAYMASESSDFSGGLWYVYSTAPSFLLSDGAGIKTVYFKTKSINGESNTRSDFIEYQPTAPPTVESFTIAEGALSTSDRNVTLDNVCSGNPDAFMASEDSNFTNGLWLAYSAAPAFVLSEGTGTKTVYFKTRSVYGESNIRSDFIDYQPVAPPKVDAFAIDSGALTTSARTVPLNNTCSGNPTAYSASENSDFSGALWYAYATAPDFELSAGEGIKTVYFKTRSINGESNVRSDFINYQPAAPPTVDAFVIANDVATTSERTVLLNNTCSDNPTAYSASESSDFSGALWYAYATAPDFELSAGEGIKTVYFKTRSINGESNVRSDFIDYQPAAPPSIDSFVIASDALMTSVRTVPLNNVCSGNPNAYSASESSDFSGALWYAYATAPDFELSEGAGIKTVYFKTRSVNGESDPRSDTIDYQPASPPTVDSFALEGGASLTSERTVSLDNSCSGNPNAYSASESSDFSGALWYAYATAPDFDLSASAGTKTVYFKTRSVNGESNVREDLIEYQPAAPPTVDNFVLASGATSTAARTVSLNNVCSGNPNAYSASESSDFSGALWYAYATAPDFELSASEGMKTVYFKTRSVNGESGIHSDSIMYQPAAPPTVDSFSIASGAASTSELNVPLNNTCSGNPHAYMASENSDFSGALWMTYSTQPIFTLSSGAGTKTVYFKTKSVNGESNTRNDTIVYEPAAAPVVDSFVIANNASTTSTRTVTLDNVCSGNPSAYMASEDSGFSSGVWLAYSVNPEFTLADGSGAKTVYFKTKSINGESGATNDTIVYQPPSAPVVNSFALDNGAATTADRDVTLNNTCVDNPTAYIASENSDFSGAFWMAYSTAPTFTLSTGTVTKTVYFKTSNTYGESGATNDTIVYQTDPPPTITSFVINNDDFETASPNVTLQSVCTGSPNAYQASENSNFSGANWMAYSSSLSFILSAGSNIKTVYFKVKNTYGESASTNDIIVYNGL